MDGRKKISLRSALLIVALIVLWRLGTFDQALVNVGLNAKPCIRNGFGATFCGNAAKEYCESEGSEAGGCSAFGSSAVREENGHIVQEVTPEQQREERGIVEERHAECAPNCVGENEPSG